MRHGGSLALATALLVFPCLAEASAQRPGDERASGPSATANLPRESAGGVGTPATGKRPDLACTIVVTERPHGHPGEIVGADGGSFRYAGGDPSVWARISVENRGSAAAKLSSTRVVVKRDGRTIAGVGYATFGAAAGEVPYMDPIRHEIELAAGSHAYEVRARVDEKGAIDEANESDNECALSFTAEVAKRADPDGSSRLRVVHPLDQGLEARMAA